MKRLLYIDTPFMDGFGGDKNRSRFLYRSLCQKYDTDVLLITDSNQDCSDQYKIRPSEGSPFEPESVYSFSFDATNSYKKLLRNGKYDIVFIRFCSPANLADIASQVLPGVKIVVDVDMLLSRISALSWQMNRSIKNRFYFLENLKLRWFERGFFNKNYLFLFSNPVERDMVTKKIFDSSAVFDVIPNIMDKPTIADVGQGRHILFYGALSSAANEDAYRYLAEDIYKLIEPHLKKHNVRIRIVGKDMNPTYEQLKADYKMDMVDLVGKVDDISAEIKSSMFVALPLRVASGTRTRILEAAAVERCVVTTTIGAEGLDFSKDEIAIADSPRDFAQRVAELLDDPKRTQEMSKTFYKKSYELYAADVVAGELVERIEAYCPRTLNVAIITNRFYPEVGGAETNIFFQATELAKKCNVTVMCPKRIDAPCRERINKFALWRLKDIFNLSNKYPNIKTKTFTPSVFFKILSKNYDVVMCFPALSYNNMAAFIAAKLAGAAVILCCFDWLDYSAIMLRDGRIDPDMIKDCKPRFYQKFFLKRFDHIFAIADKEIEFFRRYNKNVGYSPVPILMEEYSRDVANPRGAYGIGDGEFVFLSLGRVSKIKGQDIALDAFVRAADKMPDAKLVYVGRYDYDQEMYENMKRVIADKGLGSRVLFAGMVQRDEVLGWLRNSDIHVIPVRFMNSGAVVVESWISHTPVLQSDVVDPNLVQDGKTGYLFKSQSVDDLADKMLIAYKNRQNLRQMGTAGEELVKQKYTYEYLINLYLETFEKIRGEKI